MPEIPRFQLVLGGVVAVVVALIGVRALSSGEGAPAAASGRAPAPAATSQVAVERAPVGPVLVHVAGAVAKPGVYTLHDGDRVQDAVRRAGGPTRRADGNAINLAAKVADGQQVVVPERATASPAAAAAGAPGAPTTPAAPVGLNSATAEQLETLDGVGPATAEKIIAWRTEHGGFRSVDDLGQVAGIGPKKLAAIRPHVQP